MKEMILELKKTKDKKGIAHWGADGHTIQDASPLNTFGDVLTTSHEIMSMPFLKVTPVEALLPDVIVGDGIKPPETGYEFANMFGLDIHHVTSVGGCLRTRQLDNEGVEPLKTVHSVTAKGSMLHEACEALNKSIVKRGHHYYNPDELFTYDNLLSERNKARIPEWMFNELMPDVIGLTEKMSDWILANMNHYRDDVHPIEVERTMYHLVSVAPSSSGPWRPIAVLTGTPDLYNKKTVLDFKSGSRHMRNHSAQVAFYCFMLYLEDGQKRKGELIYLGKGNVNRMSREVNTEEGKELYTLLGNLREHISKCREVDETGFAPAVYGFHCSFCQYRHACYGI